MKKGILMMVLIMVSSGAYAQERSSSMRLILAKEKPNFLQEQLAIVDSCLWNRATCHSGSFFPDTGITQPWLVGGAKLKMEIGHLAFSIGRRRESSILPRTFFVESSYQLGIDSSVNIGVQQTPIGNFWYLMMRKAL